MLKGRDVIEVLNGKQTPLSAEENTLFSPQQDTLRPTQNQNTINSPGNQEHTSISNPVNQQLKDSVKTYYPAIIAHAKTDTLVSVTDTISHKYSLYIYPELKPKEPTPVPENFLLNIPASLSQNQAQKKSALISGTETGFLEGKIRSEANMDWFTIIILLTLFAFSWVKLVYQKFLVQIVAGLIDYQVSMRLYRERNVLYRNVSFGLHFVFYVNVSLFIYYLFDYYGITHIFPHTFLNVIFFSLVLLLVYNVKSLVSKTLGFIFLVKENFSQYMHNVHLYNKNIGLFLFPVIIIYPFTYDERVKTLIIYAGIVLLVALFLLRSFRSAQIILKKGISLFYLILYLCAVEILPVLLLVKLARTWIFNYN